MPHHVAECPSVLRLCCSTGIQSSSSQQHSDKRIVPIPGMVVPRHTRGRCDPIPVRIQSNPPLPHPQCRPLLPKWKARGTGQTQAPGSDLHPLPVRALTMTGKRSCPSHRGRIPAEEDRRLPVIPRATGQLPLQDRVLHLLPLARQVSLHVDEDSPVLPHVLRGPGVLNRMTQDRRAAISARQDICLHASPTPLQRSSARGPTLKKQICIKFNIYVSWRGSWPVARGMTGTRRSSSAGMRPL